MVKGSSEGFKVSGGNMLTFILAMTVIASAVAGFYGIGDSDSVSATEISYVLLDSDSDDSDSDEIYLTSISIPKGTTVDVNVNVGNGGYSSIVGNRTIDFGTDLYIVITPDAGYKIDKITLNGAPTRTTDLMMLTYITEDTAVDKTFAPEISVADNAVPMMTVLPIVVTTFLIILGAGIFHVAKQRSDSKRVRGAF